MESMEDRRRGLRHRTWCIVNLENDAGGEWLAMSRNMSMSGVLLATAAKLDVDERVRLRFKVTPTAEDEQECTGRVVRWEADVEDRSGMWPHHVAIEFDDLYPEVDPLCEADTASWTPDYLEEDEES